MNARTLAPAFAWVVMCAGMTAAAQPARANDGASTAAIDAALKSTARLKSDYDEDERRKARDVLTFASVKPGMAVADMFSAGGYYTELLSRIVGPKGRVIAYNNAEFAKFAEKDIAARYADNRLPNVEQVTAPVESVRLAPNSLDEALFIMAYHDLYWRPKDGSWPQTDPAALLERVHAALKPGGIVIVQDHIDVAGADPLVNVDKVHRIDPARVRKDFEKAGFTFDGESKALAHPADDHTKLVFDDAVRFKTDQFIYRFRK
jgi:predicted methyltransferase